MQIPEQNFWKRCSSCKKEIAFGGRYYLCSVSTCKHKRKGFRFCSVPCWDEHLGFANHREAWAEEAKAPSRAEFEAEEGAQARTFAATAAAKPAAPQGQGGGAPERPAVRKIVGPFSPSPRSAAAAAPQALETLVVVSKVKDYIRGLSDFNTSQCCIDALTRKVAEECRRAIQRAKEDNRRTVKGRDVV